MKKTAEFQLKIKISYGGGGQAAGTTQSDEKARTS